MKTPQTMLVTPMCNPDQTQNKKEEPFDKLSFIFLFMVYPNFIILLITLVGSLGKETVLILGTRIGVEPKSLTTLTLKWKDR